MIERLRRVYTEQVFRAPEDRRRSRGEKRRKTMQNLIKAIVLIAALGFILAVVGSLTGYRVLSIRPEAYSLACTSAQLPIGPHTSGAWASAV